MAGVNRGDLAVTLHIDPNPCFAARLDARHLRVFAQIYAVTNEAAAHKTCQFAVFARKTSCRFDNGHLRSEAAKRLAEFHADRSAADDDQMARSPFETEDRFIGQVGYAVQTGNRWNHG
jgi:hypothetical protein